MDEQTRSQAFEQFKILLEFVADPSSPESDMVLQRLTESQLQEFSESRSSVRQRLDIFEKIFGELSGPSKASPQGHSRPTQDHLETLVKQATLSAWRAPYQGIAHERLHRAIRDALQNNSGGPYLSFFSIIQSSGMGKSRMVDSVAQQIFTIPFNIRASERDHAYPLPDTNVREHFGKFVEWRDRRVVSGDFLVFFESLFRVIEEEINVLPESEEADFSLVWHSHLQSKDPSGFSVRRRIYDAAISRANQSCSVVEQEGEHLKLIASKDRQQNTNISWFREAAIKRSEQASQTLRSAIEKRRPETAKDDLDPTVLMYFDESDTLFQKYTVDIDGHRDTFFNALCSALNAMSERKIFTLFLSTNSRLHKDLPSRDILPSSRAQNLELPSHAPFVELSFDCSPLFPLYKSASQSQLLTLNHISTLEFMCAFGRPLFWTRFASADPEIRSEIVAFAEEKLICSKDYDRFLHNDIDKVLNCGIRAPIMNPAPAARLAVLDLRLCLDFETHREAVAVESQLVESHMRVAYSVPAHQTYCFSGYPSEPILAEAAARLMAKLRASGGDTVAIPSILQKYVRGGLISKGERGELIARLILIMAFDRAQERLQSKARDINYSAAVPLAVFLQALVGSHWDTIKGSLPDNVLGGKTFEEAFKDAKVRFTHFNRAWDDSGCTSLAAMAAFLRAMAIQCHTTKEGIDIIIPICFDGPNGDGNRPIRHEHISGILISIKNRERASNHAKVLVDEAQINFFYPLGEAKENPNPYIVIVMELGVRTPPPKAASSSNPLKRDRSHTTDVAAAAAAKKAKTDDAKLDPMGTPYTHNSPSKIEIGGAHRLRSSSRKGKRHPHPRYTIFIHGCSPTVYPVIGDSQECRAIYTFLLGARKMLDEHPRPDKIFVDAVKALKPGWTEGNNCYHWFGLGDSVDEGIELEEGVTVGQVEEPLEDDEVPH